MITITYDDAKMKDDEIVALSHAIQQIVKDATKIDDVFVYADSPKITLAVAPIEIFVQMSATKIPDREMLFQEMKLQLLAWKESAGVSYPINLTLMPMDWKFEVGI